MSRELSLAHLTMIEASPPDLVSIAGQAGYQYVGLRLTEVTGGDAWPIIADAGLLGETLAAMETWGVAVLDVELARLTPEARVQDFQPMLETAVALGAKHVLTQAHDHDRARLTDNYAALCDACSLLGLTADLEFLTWTDMRGLAEARSLVGAVDRDSAGIMIDTLHFSRSQCRLEEISELPSNWLHYLQVSDALGPPPQTKEGLIFTARQDRQLPGEGDLDLVGILSRLPRNIPVAVEIPNADAAAIMTPLERAQAAREATLQLLDIVASQPSVSRSSAADRPDLR